MKQPFCDHHICAFLQVFANKPLDIALSEYFKSHKSLGAQDRRTIGETLYGMVRWKTLIDYFCPSELPKERLRCFRNLSITDCSQDSSIPEPIRYGMNEFLYSRFCSSFGKEKAKNLCQILNGPAPTTIRVNPIKASREQLLELFGDQASPCESSPWGIQFKKRTPLFSLPEFKQGFFEMQDEGSQIVAAQVAAKPGDLVLDYCSGSGGKTLAFAPFMQGKGQIYLHDIRPWVLQEAKKRLRRAGIQNGQCLVPGHPQLDKIKGKMDWVIIDVPCSGTGTLRRNPDAKWKIDQAMVERLIEEQRKIAANALEFLKKGGRLLYATCSLLAEENEDQTAFFLKSHSLTLENTFSLFPKEGGMDGFYSALFRKN